VGRSEHAATLSYAPPDDGRDASGLYSLPAEQAVLGGLLMANDAWDRIGDLVAQGDFRLTSHQVIFRSISRLIEANKPADPVTVGEDLSRSGDIEHVDGGLLYLNELFDSTPSAANIRRHAEIVRERAVLRRLLKSLSQGTDLVYNPGPRSTSEVVDAVQSQVMAVAEKESSAFGGLNPVGMGIQRVMNQLDTLAQRPPGTVSGVPTGFVELDDRIDGMHPGDLIILAARPSMGKTAMLCNIVEHVALSAKLPAAVFSMEMSEDQLAMRMMAAHSGVNSQRLRVGRLNPKDWDRLGVSMGILNDAPIFLDEQGNLTVGTIRARARKLRREHGELGLVAIDYVQLMRGDHGGGKGGNRVEEISEISRGLKSMAKELKCPVLLLSQLNRGVESRPNKRPMLSDLRESGGLEQDADTILFIYRDEYYNPESPDRGTAEIIIGKQRNGPIGTVRLSYYGDNTRFQNLQ